MSTLLLLLLLLLPLLLPLQLTAILRETHYLQQMGREEIPQTATQLYERGETFRKYTNSLSVTIEWWVGG